MLVFTVPLFYSVHCVIFPGKTLVLYKQCCLARLRLISKLSWQYGRSVLVVLLAAYQGDLPAILNPDAQLKTKADESLTTYEAPCNKPQSQRNLLPFLFACSKRRKQRAPISHHQRGSERCSPRLPYSAGAAGAIRDVRGPPERVLRRRYRGVFGNGYGGNRRETCLHGVDIRGTIRFYV